MSTNEVRYETDLDLTRAKSLLLLACDQVGREPTTFSDDVENALLVAIDLLDEARNNLAKIGEQAKEVVS